MGVACNAGGVHTLALALEDVVFGWVEAIEYQQDGLVERAFTMDGKLPLTADTDVIGGVLTVFSVVGIWIIFLGVLLILRPRDGLLGALVVCGADPDLSSFIPNAPCMSEILLSTSGNEDMFEGR